MSRRINQGRPRAVMSVGYHNQLPLRVVSKKNTEQVSKPAPAPAQKAALKGPASKPAPEPQAEPAQASPRLPEAYAIEENNTNGEVTRTVKGIYSGASTKLNVCATICDDGKILLHNVKIRKPGKIVCGKRARIAAAAEEDAEERGKRACIAVATEDDAEEVDSEPEPTC